MHNQYRNLTDFIRSSKTKFIFLQSCYFLQSTCVFNYAVKTYFYSVADMLAFNEAQYRKQ